jgi:hypothetical protein
MGFCLQKLLGSTRDYAVWLTINRSESAERSSLAVNRGTEMESLSCACNGIHDAGPILYGKRPFGSCALSKGWTSRMAVFFYYGSFTFSYSVLGGSEAGSTERGLKTFFTRSCRRFISSVPEFICPRFILRLHFSQLLYFRLKESSQSALRIRSIFYASMRSLTACHLVVRQISRKR